MKLYSRHLFDKGIDVHDHAVIRINFAWYRKGMRIHSNHDLFFDYPCGRKKPPHPVISMEDAINVASCYGRARYFAVSNAEFKEDMKVVREMLPTHIKLVPKIETRLGVVNLLEIVKGAKTDMVMLDTEDLYADTLELYDDYLSEFNKMVKHDAFYTDEIGLKVLRTAGVIFCDY